MGNSLNPTTPSDHLEYSGDEEEEELGAGKRDQMDIKSTIPCSNIIAPVLLVRLMVAQTFLIWIRIGPCKPIIINKAP